MHHPELRKVEVREALNLAIDCETLMEQLFANPLHRYGNIAQTGMVDITPENSAGYLYDPDRGRQLLKEANYDPSNKITLSIRSQRVPKDVEYGEAVVTYWTEVFYLGFAGTPWFKESSGYRLRFVRRWPTRYGA